MLQGEPSAILSTFIKLPFVIQIFVLSILNGRFTQVLLYNIFEWLISCDTSIYTMGHPGFIVCNCMKNYIGLKAFFCVQGGMPAAVTNIDNELDWVGYT